MGNTDNFPTERLETRLSKCGIIKPTVVQEKKKERTGLLRGAQHDPISNEDDDDDWSHSTSTTTATEGLESYFFDCINGFNIVM